MKKKNKEHNHEEKNVCFLTFLAFLEPLFSEIIFLYLNLFKAMKFALTLIKTNQGHKCIYFSWFPNECSRCQNINCSNRCNFCS